MKLVRLTTLYPSYLRSYENRNPEQSKLTYSEQKNSLDYDSYGWADYWTNAFSPLGYQVEEFAANVEPLQRAWARENDVPFSDDWIFSVVRAQIKKAKPEILFINDYTTFTARWLSDLRRECSTIRAVVGWCGAPFSDESVFSEYDLVLTCIPELQESFRKMGKRVRLISHAFDPRILTRTDLTREPMIEFSFVGQILRSKGYHQERGEMLEYLAEHTPIQIFSPCEPLSFSIRMKTLLKQGLWLGLSGLRDIGIADRALESIPVVGKVASWKEMPILPTSPRLSPHIREAVFGLQMFQTLRDSKITFNSHIGLSADSASNMRLFEATGVGTCLLTDWKPNISEYFKPEDEVVTYRTVEECAEKVKWLLAHPVERTEIARRGQQRTLKDHSFVARAVKMDEIFRELLQ